MYLLLEEPCVAYYHSRYREVPLVLLAVLEVSVCSTQWSVGLYEAILSYNAIYPSKKKFISNKQALSTNE